MQKQKCPAQCNDNTSLAKPTKTEPKSEQNSKLVASVSHVQQEALMVRAFLVAHRLGLASLGVSTKNHGLKSVLDFQLI